MKEEIALGLSRHSVRYPYFYKSPYTILHKKSPLQQTDNSETVEVFSSAPPSILGSLSVFGHATVNAREPASRITHKLSRPQILSEQSEHHPYYQHHHLHHAHDHQKTHIPLYSGYEERTLYDPSLRPPPREHVAESAISLVPHPHSSSLTPNSYFFETPQPFQPPISDIGNGYHKLRKPVYKPATHNPYRLANSAQLYTSVNPLDQFKTPTHLPTSYEDNLNFDRGMNKFSKYNIHLSKPSGLSSYYSRNPFGDIHLSTRRPEVGMKYGNQDRNNIKDEYDQYAQVSGRPFQKPPSFTPSPLPPKDYDNKPYVTTYSSVSSTPNSPKFSNAQSFNYQNYENRDIVSSTKPDFVVTHQPFTDSTYPYTVTTVEVPIETSPNPGKVVDETAQSSNRNTWDQTVKTHTTFDVTDARQPQVSINSFSGFNDREPLFLPTPSTDTGLRSPVPQEQPVSNNIRSKPINGIIEYQEEKKTEDTTEYFTTEVPEITTKPPRQFTKNRRRPVNKHSDTFNKFSEFDDSSNYKNHRPDLHKRRRKPPYGGRGADRNRQSEFKKQRTTTTTQEPDVYEPTLYNNEFSTMPVTEDVLTNTQVFTTDISIKTDYEPIKNEYDQHADLTHYRVETPENEVKTTHNYKTNGYIEEALTTAHPPVPLTVLTSPSTTTTTTTTERPETSTNPISSISSRLKNKYGNNRPRFSVKEYRERLNRGTSTTTSTPEDTTEKLKSPVKEQQEILKNTVRIRGSSQYKPLSDSNSTITDSNKRKYKPRVGPSRYRISTSTSTSSVSSISSTTTTERTNTFRPSTNRYKPGTGKYYSRYRTTTASPKDSDESTPAPVKVVIKPKGVFSAKRKPFPLKTRFDIEKDSEDENIPQDEVMHISQGDIELSKYPDAIRNFENEVAPATVITKKMDGEATTASSSEERDELSHLSMGETISDPTGLEALRIADLTSSSSNDFHSSGFRVNNHRPLPKIAFPTEEPILPLEAFFQNHANKE